MDRVTRDFLLAEKSAEIMDKVAGLAMATVCVLKAPSRHADTKTVGLANEIAERFTAQTGLLQAFLYDFSPDMPDADLRRWAADLKTALSQ